MLIFSNPGEIDPRLITTFGVNVKPQSASPIGYFGTGLKYAIATSLRLGCKVTIQSGTRTYEFKSTVESIRGKDFGLVRMMEFPGPEGDQTTGIPHNLPFTLELGKNWLPWMAYREFRANALDEQGSIVGGDMERPEPLADWTRIIIEGEALEEIHHNSGDYFLDNEQAKLILPGVSIYDKSPSIICYQGIRMLDKIDGNVEHEFTYNLTKSQPLTEDRTLTNSWQAKKDIAMAIAQVTDQEVLAKILGSRGSTFEAKLDFDWEDLNPSTEFLDQAFIEMRKRNGLNESIKEKLKKLYSGDSEKLDELQIPDQFRDMVELAPRLPDKIENDYSYSSYVSDLRSALDEALIAAKYWKACASKLAKETTHDPQ